ncbi:MAG: 4Fe-4S dicluster domain-containing protein [Candidatus Diapherotrites archaeon]|nr:4Fe-4S dicluster domain-containing protein [Candidatus Diapherotrites archaeon]
MKKQNLIPYLAHLNKKYQVFVPAKNHNGATCFEEFSGQELCLKERTLYSVKDLYLPNKEREFFFEKKHGSCKIHETIKHRPRIVFGVRSCDLHALNVLDKLFLEFYGYDPLYKNKRNTSLVIGLSCSEPCETGFCASMGTNKPDFFDLFFWEKKDGYFVEIGSPSWEKLYHKKFFEETEEKKGTPIEDCKLELNTADLEDILEKNFEHGIWNSESKRCLSCSSCTEICPTCHCFTVEDNFLLDDSGTERYREWASCQLQRFTKIHGAILRASRKSRLRQFVMHKLSYFKQQHNVHLCVGCGRCIQVCPVKISLVDIAEKIRGEGNA